jgi:hypothetical protein
VESDTRCDAQLYWQVCRFVQTLAELRIIKYEISQLLSAYAACTPSESPASIYTLCPNSPRNGILDVPSASKTS